MRPVPHPALRPALRLAMATSAALLLLTAAACGGDSDDDPDSGSSPESEQVSADADASGSPAAGSDGDADSDGGEGASSAGADSDATTRPGPCDLVGSDDVAAAFGTPVDGGTDRFGGHSENNVEYSSVDCTWEAEDQLEVELELSFADDFEQGMVCQTVSYLGDEGKPVDVAGADSASWLASEDPNEIEARLRACTDSAVITLHVEDETGSNVPQLRAAAIAVAEEALANLP